MMYIEDTVMGENRCVPWMSSWTGNKATPGLLLACAHERVTRELKAMCKGFLHSGISVPASVGPADLLV